MYHTFLLYQTGHKIFCYIIIVPKVYAMIYETTKPTGRPPTYHTSFFITFISKSINTYKESQSLKAEYYMIDGFPLRRNSRRNFFLFSDT